MRKRFNERGGGMLEAAVVFPVVALVTMAVIDAGLYFSSRTSAGNAAREGARTIAVAGADTSADYYGLQTMARSLSSMSSGKVTRIVVFDANNFNPEVPTPCRTGKSNSGVNCNVYVPADLSRPQADFDENKFDGPSGWTAGERRVSRSLGTGLVGVAVTATISTPLGVFGGTEREVTRVVVVQLEAQQP